MTSSIRFARKSLANPARLAFATAAAVACLGLSGCGAGDVELNGKIFDALGVSSATQQKSGDPKVAARNGLVMPPSTGSLPVPGSGPPPEAEADLAFINDPDRKKTVDKTELARRQEEYCKVHYEQAKARGDTSADSAVGPAGACRPTFLSAMKMFQGDKKDDDEESGD